MGKHFACPWAFSKALMPLPLSHALDLRFPLSSFPFLLLNHLDRRRHRNPTATTKRRHTK